MNSIFAADSALMRGLTRIADVMILNLLFVATSLPVVTLGASLTALHFTAMRLAAGESESTSGDYLRSFRQNLRQGTVVLLLHALVVAALAAWYAVIPAFGAPALLELALFALWYVVAFAFASWALYVFPYLARFEGSTRDVLRLSRLISMRHPLATLTMLVVIALAVAVTVFAPQATGYGMLWLLVGFGGVAVVNGGVLARVFGRYTSEG